MICYHVSMSRTKIITIALLSGAGIIILFNFPYVQTHVEYYFQKDEIKEQAAEQTAAIQEKGELDRLQIPTLGITAPVIYVQEQSEEVFQEALQSGVVHFPGTALPGQPGNVYIFGHSSDNVWAKGGYKTIFALLPKMQPQDLILITDSEGNLYKYQVRETKVVSPQDTHVLDQGKNSRKLLTLQTSYPIGTSLKRFLVIAEIAE